MSLASPKAALIGTWQDFEGRLGIDEATAPGGRPPTRRPSLGGATANWIEALGFATGIASVWLSARQHVAAWPVGIISDSNRLLFCATDALATAIWHERYLGSFSAATSAASRSDRYDLVLLADNDFPWTDDGTRNSSTVRHAMQRRFRDQLTAVWP